MAEFEMFYILDSRAMSNTNYISYRDQQLPLDFNTLNFDEYIVCELENHSYVDLTTYVLFVVKHQDEIDENEIKYKIAPKKYKEILSRINCYKFADITIDNYNCSGFVKKSFFEKMHDYQPIFKYTYPSYIHMTIKKFSFYNINWINQAYYKSSIELLHDIISDDFIITENYLSKDVDVYYFCAGMSYLLKRETPEKVPSENMYLKSNAYKQYLALKGLDNPQEETSIKSIPTKEKKSSRKVFVFD
jgi:hypothetical protein